VLGTVQLEGVSLGFCSGGFPASRAGMLPLAPGNTSQRGFGVSWRVSCNEAGVVRPPTDANESAFSGLLDGEESKIWNRGPYDNRVRSSASLSGWQIAKLFRLDSALEQYIPGRRMSTPSSNWYYS